jgi:hypothetical protein
MLRLIWILPAGCVLLAIVVLALAFGASDRSHSQLMPNVALMRVAMIELPEHPESRQFLTLSAIRRTDELNRLRELLDTQGTDDSALAAPTIALLANRSDSDPEANNYETDWNVQSPAPAPVDVSGSPSVQADILDEKQVVGTQEEKPAIATLDEKPIAIQEGKPTVATREENPQVTTPDKKSAVIRTPPRVESPNESRAKGGQHVRIRARAPVKQESPSPQYFFFEPFGSQQTGQTSAVNNTNYFGYQQPRPTPAPSANNYFANQRTGPTQTPNARAPVKQESPSPQYFFQPFGSQQTGQTSAVNNTNYFGYQHPRQTPTPRVNNYFANQRTGPTQTPNRAITDAAR